MANREGNKGNLQYLAGEFLNTWGFANLQTQGDAEVLDKGVFTLDAIAYPITRRDEDFKAAFQALDGPDKNRVDVRYGQMRLLVAALYDAGILSDKGVPFYDDAQDPE